MSILPVLSGLTVGLIVLKLAGHFDYSWWIVCFPLMVSLITGVNHLIAGYVIRWLNSL